MKKLTIYHNPRCSKSRETLQIIENHKLPVNIVKYLKNPLSENDIKKLLNKLDISSIKLVRKTEKIYKDNYKGKELSDAEIIQAMAEHPKLIQRPIVETEDKAIIGRPPENVLELLKN